MVTVIDTAGFPHTASPFAGAAWPVPHETYSQLQEAFQQFNDAAARFQEQYAKLETRVAELNLELDAANKRLTSNLREKQKVQDYLATLLESLPVGVLGLDGAGRVLSSNRRATEILELSAEELRGNDLRNLLQTIPPIFSEGDSCEVQIDSPKVPRKRILKLQRVRTGATPQLETLEIGGYLSAALNPDVLFPAFSATDEDLPEPDVDSVVLIEDITEIRRLENQDDRNNRLAAMGEIAVNVAHEIRNPLGSIELFASMLQRDLAQDEKNGPLAAHICSGVRCVDHIVSNILQFSRPTRLVCADFDLHELIEETLLFAEHALRQKGVAVQRNFANKTIPLTADAELLKQMFLNLFLNAIQATPEGGVVGVDTIPNCKTVEVRVWDSGCGFAPGMRDKIFDPFFTTRRKGTGLGLTIVHNIITAHEGSIEADNRSEGGAMFSIVLPKKTSCHCDGKEFSIVGERQG